MEDFVLLITEALRETAKAIKYNNHKRLEILADFMENESREHENFNDERTARGKCPVSLEEYRRRTNEN